MAKLLGGVDRVNLLERKLFKEQVRKELLDEFKQYEVGLAHNGVIAAYKTASWEGHIFVIPEDKYQEWIDAD